MLMVLVLVLVFYFVLFCWPAWRTVDPTSNILLNEWVQIRLPALPETRTPIM
jgi:hypothetical protein